VVSVDPLFTQGGFESASSVTDMAIDGKGFFVVQNATDSTN
jgi:flagellar hook protein FlgE